MNVTGILETALHVENVTRSREFYQNIFGFPVLQGDDRFCALSVADRQVLRLKRGPAPLVVGREPATCRERYEERSWSCSNAGKT